MANEELKYIDGIPVLTVSQVNSKARYILEQNIPMVWVEGEISNLKKHASGHLYFGLKDKEAFISAVMFRSDLAMLYFAPGDGMKVLALGNITLFEAQGQYQIRVIKMTQLGIGALQQAFEELKRKLFKEGLFDESHKKPIPYFPKKIGVITSPTGAAIKDIIRIITSRNPCIEIIVRPSLVQGKEAVNDLVQAINDFNAYGDVDVIIFGRGGGSIEDLWAFNEEAVAYAIYNSKIPIVSAVGHEVDFTISDFVADKRAATPSHSAELLSPKRDELIYSISIQYSRLVKAIENLLSQNKQVIQLIEQRYGLRRVKDFIDQKTQQLDMLSFKLQNLINDFFFKNYQKINFLNQKLSNLNPENVLKRGYSIIISKRTKKIISSIKNAFAGEKIEIKFSDGKASGKIESTENDNLKNSNLKLWDD